MSLGRKSHILPPSDHHIAFLRRFGTDPLLLRYDKGNPAWSWRTGT